MTTSSGLRLAQGARSWRRNPDMFRRKKGKAADPEITAAQVHAEESLQAARHQRDSEAHKLRTESEMITEPLREVRRSNHLAEMFTRALRGE